MKDEEIIERLRAVANLSGLSVALVLDGLVPGGVSHGHLVTYFKRAFPEIPLRTLLDAGGWHRVGNGHMTDAQFDDLLRQWLPRGEE